MIKIYLNNRGSGQHLIFKNLVQKIMLLNAKNKRLFVLLYFNKNKKIIKNKKNYVNLLFAVLQKIILSLKSLEP